MVIDEAYPKNIRELSGDSVIHITNSKNKTIDRLGLESALEELRNRHFDTIIIDPSSRLSSCWPSSYFPSIRVAKIMGKKIESIEALRHLNLLIGLHLSNVMPEALANLKELKLQRLNMEMGGQGRWIASCKYLENFCCHDIELVRFPLKSLAQIPKLYSRNLRIEGGAICDCKGVNAVSVFFRNCTRLEWLNDLCVTSAMFMYCPKIRVRMQEESMGALDVSFGIGTPAVDLFSPGILKSSIFKLEASRIECGNNSSDKIETKLKLISCWRLKLKKLIGYSDSLKSVLFTNGHEYAMCGKPASEAQVQDVVSQLNARIDCASTEEWKSLIRVCGVAAQATARPSQESDPPKDPTP
ncbi:MAG: hypothetical protein HS116_23130 [Planctomycetes bacterium]|nr:hypothetical protein [Planctomycetota bacterium]